jgi:hypothetical protein
MPSLETGKNALKNKFNILKLIAYIYIHPLRGKGGKMEMDERSFPQG